MPGFLNAKQVQEMLQVDRTTVYRMLQDGRLAGAKIGHQWRFERAAVEALLIGGPPAPAPNPEPNAAVLPLHCVQRLQDVFAEVAQVGVVTTDPAGAPMTAISNSCAFCNLILASETGRRACQDSWARLAKQSEQGPAFVKCHAGLQYARARIELSGRELAAMLIAGQFYARPPEAAEEAARVQALARRHGIDEQALSQAAPRLPVLDERLRRQIGNWLDKVAHTFEDIGRERADFVDRFRMIAEMSKIDH